MHDRPSSAKQVACIPRQIGVPFAQIALLVLLLSGSCAGRGAAQDTPPPSEGVFETGGDSTRLAPWQWRDARREEDAHRIALNQIGNGEFAETAVAEPTGAASRRFSLFQNETAGINIEPIYTGEVFTNTRGGLSTNAATRYLALLDLVVELDFEEMDSFLPGRFFMLAQNTHGQGITEDLVGDAQFISNIDSARNITQVSEYWWEQGWLDEKVTLRLGKQDVNSEFFLMDLAADFIHSTFGLSPSTAFPTYPNPSMAAVLLLQFDDAWRLKGGIWDAFSSGGNWGFSGNDSVFLATELEYSYALGGTLPGVLAAGAAYESAGQLSGESIAPVREYILQLEQHLFRESSSAAESDQGLAAFAGYYPRFPGSPVTDEAVGSSLVAGLTYRGFLPNRDDDVMGSGVVRTKLYRGGTNRETIVELFYRMQMTDRLILQPDLQYIASPSGVYRDALAVGFRFVLTP